MGRREYRRREKKKVKKDARKISIPTIAPPPITAVEVIKKGKKEPKVEEEQEK